MSARFSIIALVVALAAAPLFAAAAPADDALAAATVVLFNKNLSESVELAKFYAAKRAIPRDHLVGLDCANEEEISREDYDATIAEPLREIFEQHHWWTRKSFGEAPPVTTSNQIKFVATIRGVPLKIRPTAIYQGDHPGPPPLASQNAASVDSELAALSLFTRQISGPLTNPYYQDFRAVADFPQSTFMLVCRLDAASAETVRRMIVDAVETEKTGLLGRAFVDGAHNTAGGLADGDHWLNTVVTQLRAVGIPTVFDDTPATFPDGYPVTDCALYYGWYAAEICGPFAQPGFRFPRGAVAVHIHSYSAETLHNASKRWVAPLLAHGAAASLGNVYEPYLQLTANLDLFNDRLLHGFTLAESAYMSLRAVSWMSVVVGDPLYRPFLAWTQIGGKSEPAKSPNEWKLAHEFAVKNASLGQPELRAALRQAASRVRSGAILEDLGGREFGDGNFAGAISCFGQARSCYPKRDDILRVVLEESDAWAKQNNPKRAAELLHSVLRIVSDGPTANLLREKERALNPAPPSP